MEDVTGASALELVPSGRGALVEQLNEASKRPRFGRWALVAAVVLLFVKPPVGVILALVASPGIIWLFLNDRARRSVVAFYDVTDDAAHWFQRVVDTCDGLGEMAKCWRINTSGRVQTTHQYKVNSGASTIISRAAVAIARSGPSQLKSNIAVPSIISGKNALHFLPDRVLVSDGKRFSDVSYRDLVVSTGSTRFIESERAPRDGTQVDTTWQFVNVRGGPDRRYKNNRQLPVMLYGELELSSPSGLHWLLNCSRQSGFADFASALRAAPSSLDATSSASVGEADPQLRVARVSEDGLESAAVFTRVIPIETAANEPTANNHEEVSGYGTTGPVEPPPVPRTPEGRASLVRQRPPAWEYLLFGSFLAAGQEGLKAKWHDYQLGLARARGRQLGVDAAMKRLTSAIDDVQDRVADLMQLFQPAALEKAFGKPGEPGDPELIEHLCTRFTDACERLLDWGTEIRSVRVPTVLAPAFETASRFVELPLETIREFVDANVAELDHLAERLRNEETIQLTMALNLEADPTVIAEFERQLASARAAL